MSGMPTCEHDGCTRHPVQFAMTCHEHLADRTAWIEEALHEIYYYGCVGGYFEACDFTGQDFKKGTLNRANLKNAVLEGCNLGSLVAMEADFSGANLSGSDAKKSVLSESKLNGANLEAVNFERANLEGTDIKDGRVKGATLKYALCHGVHAQRADLSECDLSDASFTDADLSGANLSGANIARTNFSGADLTGCNLEGILGAELVIVSAETKGKELLGR